MANNFLHGVYGEHTAYTGKKVTYANGTIPVYIGTAPINQVNANGKTGFKYDDYINKPIVIKSLPEAKEKLGYSEDFKNFTLMEAIHAHFMNGEKPIAPIVVVNMLNPSDFSNKLDIDITLTGSAGAKVGYLSRGDVKIETMQLLDEESKAIEGFTAEWVNGKVKITITDKTYTGGTVKANVEQIINVAEAITTTDFESALNALDVCEMMKGYIPTVLVAPYFSKIKEYHDLMITKATNKIANKWYIDVLADIKADSTVNTMAKAIEKKATDGYISNVEKPLYPMVKYNSKIYHLSTMCAVDMQQTDTDADGVPYISPSNKKIYADAAVLEDGTPIFISETVANTANANGLTTVNVIRGSLRLWGSCNGNYSFANESNIDPEHLQDASIRMKHYMLNKLQYDYIDNIDSPITRRDIDSILASVQQWLNSLVSEGKLLHARIDFIEDNNSVANMTSGDFVFDVSSTNTPNAKSITFRTHYTNEGLATLTSGGAE